jgi:hypothetical protein
MSIALAGKSEWDRTGRYRFSSIRMKLFRPFYKYKYVFLFNEGVFPINIL